MKMTIEPKIFAWARQRAKLDIDALLLHFPKLEDWEKGTVQPTLNQLEEFARVTRTPIGMLFLSAPPVEQLPIPDFRVMSEARLSQPSVDLLETIYICQQRQEWYQDYIQKQGMPPINCVGSIKFGSNVVKSAETIRQFLHFSIQQRSKCKTWEEALRFFKNQIEECGILVMTSGVVGSNNRRKLDLQEFRGFVLIDKLVPLIFVNGNDSKSAQMFTLAHELAHIWVGKSGISDPQAGVIPDEKNEKIEYWCNQIASELLVPLEDLKKIYCEDIAIKELASHYKVSTLVILRRIYDLGKIDRKTLWNKYREELTRLKEVSLHSVDGGGDFYRTLFAKTSKRFISVLVTNTLEGQTLFRDAFKMLGIRKTSVFYKISATLGTES